MSAITAITRRELQALFYSPIAYVVGFFFLLFVGLFFAAESLEAGQEASLRSLFDFMAKVLVFALPVLTMRSISDEFASGTIESLMTAPVSDAVVILGSIDISLGEVDR